ncbi:MAG: 2-amino-4-oxopentanoate thiolase subunit OrtA [Spirochaetia bacterium]
MSSNASKGTWVQVHNTVLAPQERASALPEETKQVPLEKWVKGFLLDETAEVGDRVRIETVIGRQVEGDLVAINPGYCHSFGVPPQELLSVGVELRNRLKEGRT